MSTAITHVGFGALFIVGGPSLRLQVQFGVIRCISDFRRPGTYCISETANRRVKRTRIWASGVSI